MKQFSVTSRFDIEVYDKNAPIEIAVYDWDRLSKNDLVGKAQVHQGSLKPGKNDLWLPIGNMNQQGKQPHVHVVLQNLPRMLVKLIEGKDLPAGDLFGGCDPFIEFKFMNNVKKSGSKMKTLNPVWNEEFSFDVHDMNTPLYVTLYDWDLGSKNDLLGQMVVTMSSLKAGRNDIWLQVPKKGAIHLDIDAQGFGQGFDQQFQQQGQFQQQQNFGQQQQQQFNQFGQQQQGFNQQQQFQPQQQQQFNQFSQQNQFQSQQQQQFNQFSQQNFQQQQFQPQQQQLNQFSQQNFQQQQFQPQQQFQQVQQVQQVQHVQPVMEYKRDKHGNIKYDKHGKPKIKKYKIKKPGKHSSSSSDSD